MNKAELFLRTLNQAGYESYFVGGCVRDKLLGRDFNDQDIATIATPEQIKEVLKNDAESMDFVGANFGVSVCDGVEIAMFRTEEYDVVSKPTVQPAKSAEEDAKRRDFTINALFETEDGEIIDFVGAKKDIEDKVIRAVGSPWERFKEDPSRILRAAYFAASFDFKLCYETARAMKDMGHTLDLVPDELKGKILLKAYKNRAISGFLSILSELDLMKHYIPELNHLKEIQMNYSNVWQYSLKLIKNLESKNSPLSSVLAGVFHKSGIYNFGPSFEYTDESGQIHNSRHVMQGAEIASNVLSRLGIGSKIINDVQFIVRYHDNMIMRRNPTQGDVRKKIKKMIPVFAKNREQLEEKLNLLFTFKLEEDCCAKPDVVRKNLKKTFRHKKAFRLFLKNNIIFRSELPVNGNDVMAYGFKGSMIASILEAMVNLNIQNENQAHNFLRDLQTKGEVIK